MSRRVIPCPAKADVAVQHDEQDPSPLGIAESRELGADPAHRDRLDRLEMARVRVQVEPDLAAGRRAQRSGRAEVVLDVAAAERSTAGSTSSKPAKISTGSRPTTCAMTFRRPRWLIASIACSTSRSAAVSNSEVSSGMSAETPSIEKRL